MLDKLKGLYAGYRTGSGSAAPLPVATAALAAVLTGPVGGIITAAGRRSRRSRDAAEGLSRRLTRDVEQALAGSDVDGATLDRALRAPEVVDGMTVSVRFDQARVVAVTGSDADLAISVAGIRTTSFVSTEGVTSCQYTGVSQLRLARHVPHARAAFERMRTAGLTVSLQFDIVAQHGRREFALLEVCDADQTLYCARVKR